MNFEAILKDVGGFGLYQKILVFVFMLPTFTVIPWFCMNLIFMTSTPDHWCYVPEVANSNLSLENQKRLIQPPELSSCSMYDVNYSQILQSGNWTVKIDGPTRPCIDGWQYDTSDYSATAVTRWNMVCENSHYSSLVLSLIFIGDMIGTPFYGYMSDRFGRKPTFLFMAVLIAVTEIGSVLSPSFVLFLFLRAVNGSTVSTIYTVAYVIFLELVSPDIRTLMNGVALMCWTVGLCLLPLVAWLTANWIRLSIVTTTAATALLLYSKLIPESPSWLISRERYEDAAAIMSKISKMNGKKEHEGTQLLQKIKELGEKIRKQKMDGEKNSPLDLFKYPTLRKRFLIITICWAGIFIPYYGLQMNVKNLAGSEFLNFFLVNVIEIPTRFITWFVMQRYGRRWYSVCAFVVATTAFAMPVLFPPEYTLVGMLASLFAKLGTSAACMTMYQQSPELLPTSLRSTGMGLSLGIATGMVQLVPFIVYLAKFGTYIPFLIFSFVTLISSICASFLPETLNKNLPQSVNDAENFERDFKYFPCIGTPKKPESEKLKNSWTPATLTIADLSLKSIMAFSDPVKDFPVLKKRTSISSVSEIPAVRNTSR